VCSAGPNEQGQEGCGRGKRRSGEGPGGPRSRPRASDNDKSEPVCSRLPGPILSL
jgi:hypothetical protein